MPKKNEEELINKIGHLIKMGYTNPEIALELSTSKARIALISQRHLGGNPNYMKKKTKHKHLREHVLLYFLTHTAEQTMEHFKLTHSEFKSCMSVAYTDKSLGHLRKDSRNHTDWTGDELITMLKYSGILRREKIGKIIKRGSARVVKEKLQYLNVSSRNINGTNLTQFRKLFGYEPKYQIRGEAGPGSFGSKRNKFAIIPWAYVLKCYVRHPNHDKTMLHIFRTYALFQKYIWNGDPWTQMSKDKAINKFLWIYDDS